MIKSELKDWTPQLRDKKIMQLASIIKKMNGEKGPDVIGVCEVENIGVMELLKDEISILDRD